MYEREGGGCGALPRRDVAFRIALQSWHLGIESLVRPVHKALRLLTCSSAAPLSETPQDQNGNREGGGWRSWGSVNRRYGDCFFIYLLLARLKLTARLSKQPRKILSRYVPCPKETSYAYLGG